MSNHAIQVFNQVEKKPSIQHDFACAVIDKIFQDTSVDPFDINVIIMGTEEHTQLNISYLSHNYPTDVITFDLTTSEEATGEIYINFEVALENATEFKATHEEELKRLMIHGMLHLVGYNDKTEAQQTEMRLKEDYYLNSFM